jgi:hypothetical protein
MLIFLTRKIGKKSNKVNVSKAPMTYFSVMIDVMILGRYAKLHRGNVTSRIETKSLSLRYGNPSSFFV